MPQVFKIGSYNVYFWAKEGVPLEPVHVHISKGVPSPNTTKVWITRAGGCYLCNNRSRIPKHILNNILRVLEARSFDIMHKWKQYFGTIDFYC